MAELGRPVEVVGPRQPRVDVAVEHRTHHVGGGEIVHEGLAEVDPERVAHHEQPQGADCDGTASGARPSGAVTTVVDGGAGDDDEEAAGGVTVGGTRGGGPPVTMGRRPFHLQHAGPGIAGVPEGALCSPHHMGQADGVRDRGDGAEHVDGHAAAGAERRVLGRAHEGGPVQDEPHREARQARQQGMAPIDLDPTR